VKWFMRTMAVVFAAFAAVTMASSSAVAAPSASYGAYSQLNCKRSSTVGSSTTCLGTIPAHSSDHWIQSKLDCTGAGTTTYEVIDAGNSQVVDSGSCSFYGSTSWKFQVGLTNSYRVRLKGSFGIASIRNCTTYCTVYIQG